MDTILCKGERLVNEPRRPFDKARETARLLNQDPQGYKLSGLEERAVAKASEGRWQLENHEEVTLRRLDNEFGHLVP